MERERGKGEGTRTGERRRHKDGRQVRKSKEDAGLALALLVAQNTK